MKIIDLLVKISKGDIPKHITKNGLDLYWNEEEYAYDIKTKNLYAPFVNFQLTEFNDEVEVIEEPKKLEKLPYYSLEKIQKAKDKELVKAIYNLQQENKELKVNRDKAIESIEKELKENNHLSYGVALSIITILNDGKILKGEENERQRNKRNIRRVKPSGSITLK